MRIDDPDANGVGEIVARHPNMFDGYYKNDEATAADLRDGWMHTGDAGYFNKPAASSSSSTASRIWRRPRAGERFSPQYHREQAEVLALSSPRR